MKVLMVEDEEQLRELVVELLREEGYLVDTAVSVTEGLAKLEESTPDVLLVDIRLGDGDGRRLIGHCRSDERLGKLSIIVMTAASWDDADNNLGVTAVVPKPFDIDAFINAVGMAAEVTGTSASYGPR